MRYFKEMENISEVLVSKFDRARNISVRMTIDLSVGPVDVPLDANQTLDPLERNKKCPFQFTGFSVA